MTWKNEPRNKDQYVGFIYCITNKTNNKKYIGKKTYWKTNKYKRVGRINKIHKKVPSDYKEYWGSSNVLLEDIRLLGEDNFERRIIKNCKSKWEMSYWELYYQMKHKVLFREDYYNGIIQVRLGKAPKKLLINKTNKK